MSNKTKKIFILALVTSCATIGLLVFFLYEIRAEGIKLEEKIAVLTENNSKESAYVKLKRLAQETEGERALLADSFFKEEGDSITFLGEVETLAANLGLALEIDLLEKIEDEASKQQFIKTTFGFEGQKDVVFNFSKLMEVTPYHSKVESLSLRETSVGNWEGELTILITINSI